MRNLKKILAMVLALVMSLSLMATAGAANFTDASSINEKYETAIEVLEGLGVFKGYDENGSYSFKPTGEITRAETAAIIYRIVTGDVTDSQVGIYADYNLFTDVPSTSWYAGYVNFCANAEYIKGVGGGKFDPSSRVTGYAALAMILRAIGYTANGGFTGPDWEVQTARTAEARKITKNIMTGTLGQPATRETVAEILFQSILVNMVDHNVLNTLNGNQGYTEIDETLGYKTFKLEQIEGIVMGNEYADLNSEQVLADGQTQLQVAGEENLRNLAITTKITDIGESRYAYITGSKVLAMGDTGNNTVTEFGHACDISTTAKFNAAAEMPAASDIEYFVNFDPWTDGGYDCDQRLEFSVVLYGISAENAFDSYKGINISRIAAEDDRYSVEVLDEGGDVTNPDDWTNITGTETNGDYVNAPNYGYPVRYTKVIWAGQTITDTDLTVLESIFGMADNANNNILAANKITGDVFVGTKSTNNSVTDEERDLSNTISYKKFFEDYINDRTREQNWGESFNGDWVKFIDNDGDGACEYAFWTGSFLDEAIHTYTNRNGDTVTEFNYFDDNTYDVPNGRYTVRYLDNDGNDTDEVPAVGDKVVAAFIDNQYLVEPALNENVTVSEYSWRNDEITTDKGTYGQSGIGNATGMQELISNMDDRTEYTVYFDHFGYVRAYELPGGTQYALLTELYYTNAQQGNLVQNWPMTVELKAGEADQAEYNVASGAATFRANYPWLLVDNLASTSNYNNWLQPAIAHLGVSRTVNGVNLGAVKNTNDIFTGGTTSTFWPANRQLVKNLTAWGNGAEFNYGVQNYGAINSVVNNEVPTKPVSGWTVNQANGTASFTNVAVVNINGNDASLSGAAQLSLNNRGEIRSWNDLDGDGVYDPGTAERPRYAVDYIQLDRTADVVAGAVRYPIGGDATYKTNNNNYVNAVHDTEYYIVYNGGVYYFKDFVNMPKLTNEDNIIHAAYAVARDTSADNSGLPYWVADVIVYEVYDLNDTAQTSVSLAYYTPTRLSGTVQQVETLNSKYGPMVTLTPGNRAWNSSAGQWGAEWEGYGFYALYNDTEPVDNVMTARDISRIGAQKTDGTFEMDYNENRIYAGIVTREAYIAGAGYYIDVDMGNGLIASIEVTDKIYSVTTQAAQSDTWYGYNEANLLRYQNLNNSQVKAGDHVIWFNDKEVKAASVANTATLNSTKFVVDLGSTEWCTGVYAGADLMTDTPNWLIGLNRDVQGRIIYDAQGKPVVLTPTATSTSEWQKIMYEQTAPVAPTPVTRNITLTLPEVAARAAAAIPANAKITDVFSSISITAGSETKVMTASDDGKSYTCTFTFDDGNEPAMYSYSYVLAAGYAAADVVAEFVSDDATFDNSAKVFVPKAGVATIVVDLVRDSVVFDEDSVASDELRITKEEAKVLVDEYVTAKIDSLDAADKAIVEANMTAVNTAKDTAKTAIADAADASAVAALIAEAEDGTISGTQVTALDTAISNVVTEIKSARTSAETELRALASTLANDAAAAVLAERLPELNEAMTTTAVGEVKDSIKTAMEIAATPAATPVTPGDLDNDEEFGEDGTFEGMQNFITTASSIVKSTTAANTYDITVSFPMTKTYTKDSEGPFTGFGTGTGDDGAVTGADVLTANGITGDAQNGVWFGFVAFQIEGSDTVIMIVGKTNAAANTEYTSSGSVDIDGTTYTANFHFTFQ